VPVCETCEGFDTLSWKSPPAPKVSAPTGVEVLPLIVGDVADDVVDDAEVLDAEAREK